MSSRNATTGLNERRGEQSAAASGEAGSAAVRGPDKQREANAGGDGAAGGVRRKACRGTDDALRIIAATLGTLPVALFGAACIARFLPVSADARYAIAFTAVIPLWVTAMCVAFLARRGARALVVCILAAAVMATLVYAV